MRVRRDIWKSAVGKCHERGTETCRLYSRDQMDLCTFDEGFLLGFLVGLRQRAPTKLEGDLMADQPLTVGNSIPVTITDTDVVTGAVVTIDPGSLTATLSDTTDTAVVNADDTITLTAGTSVATDKTITVNATVGGIASEPWVGAYDVVAAPDATALSGTFGTETAP